MDFNFTEEQQLLADTVRRFVREHYSFEARREILKSKDGWSRELWQQHGTPTSQIECLAEIVAAVSHEAVAYPGIGQRRADEFDVTRFSPRAPVHHTKTA